MPPPALARDSTRAHTRVSHASRWQDAKNVQPLLRPSWIGLNARLAAAAFAHMNIAIAVFPFVSAAFRPASTTAPALHGSAGAVYVLAMLLLQWVSCVLRAATSACLFCCVCQGLVC